MEIFGHSGGTALVTLLVGGLAVGFLFSGVWGLSGRDVWLPAAGVLSGEVTVGDDHTTLRGRPARAAGAALLAFGLLFAVAAFRIWRGNAF